MAYTLQSFARTITDADQRSEWNSWPVARRKDYVADLNRRQRALAKANKPKKHSRGGVRKSKASESGASDAFTRQGRMSAADWNATFHA